jgi:hypothetical protein
MSNLYHLVNCLEHDIYINTHAGLVSLPRLARPELLHSPGESEIISLGVPGDKHLSSEVECYSGIVVYGATNVPPVLDGMIYIVPLPTLFQFPEREDFMIANLWEIGSSNYIEGTEFVELVHILNGITRAPFNVTSVKGMEDITSTSFLDKNTEIDDSEE